MDIDISLTKIIKPSIGILCGILVYYGILQYIILNIITLIYVISKSVVAIENDGENTTKMWIMLMCIINIDYILNMLSSMMPFGFLYQFVRICALIWMNRSDNNINNMYDRTVKIVYKKYGNVLDEYINTIDAYKSYMNEKLDGIVDISYDTVSQILTNHKQILQKHIKDDKTD